MCIRDSDDARRGIELRDVAGGVLGVEVPDRGLPHREVALVGLGEEPQVVLLAALPRRVVVVEVAAEVVRLLRARDEYARVPAQVLAESGGPALRRAEDEEVGPAWHGRRD